MGHALSIDYGGGKGKKNVPLSEEGARRVHDLSLLRERGARRWEREKKENVKGETSSLKKGRRSRRWKKKKEKKGNGRAL